MGEIPTELYVDPLIMSVSRAHFMPPRTAEKNSGFLHSQSGRGCLDTQFTIFDGYALTIFIHYWCLPWSWYTLESSRNDPSNISIHLSIHTFVSLFIAFNFTRIHLTSMIVLSHAENVKLHELWFKLFILPDYAKQYQTRSLLYIGILSLFRFIFQFSNLRRYTARPIFSNSMRLHMSRISQEIIWRGVIAVVCLQRRLRLAACISSADVIIIIVIRWTL